MTYEKGIEIQRKRIDRIDEEIFKKILERVKIAKKIGKIKRKYDAGILDKSREERVMEKVRDFAVKNKIAPEKVGSIFRDIINLCREEE